MVPGFFSAGAKREFGAPVSAIALSESWFWFSGPMHQAMPKLPPQL